MKEKLAHAAMSPDVATGRSRRRGACRDLARDWARWTRSERITACALAILVAAAAPAGIVAMSIHAST
jgi:hypothetical protein